MAYKIQKGTKQTVAKKIGAYKGGASASEMPFNGGIAKVTKTNRATGEKTTTKEKLKPITKAEYNSGRITKQKQARPITKSTGSGGSGNKTRKNYMY